MTKQKAKTRKPRGMVNSKARFDYDLEDSFLAGIVLSGAEAKSIRSNRVSMKGSFITLKNGEAWLNNMQVSAMVSNSVNMPEDVQSRARKLLLTKKELGLLQAAKDQGRTIVPTELLTKRYIKVRISTAKGKRKYDKRETIKRRTQTRDAAKAMSRLVRK